MQIPLLQSVKHVRKFSPNTGIKKEDTQHKLFLLLIPLQYTLSLLHNEPSVKARPLTHLMHTGAYLHPYGLEESRMSQGKFHHLLDLSQLLPAATNVIIAHLIQ